MAGWLTRLETRGTLAGRLAALCGMIALVALALMTVADVLMRWLFNAPIDGVADVGPLVVAIAVAATFPFAVAGRHHVALGLLGSLLGPRRRAWLDALAAAVTTVFFVLFAWQFVLHAIKLAERGQTTWILGLPVAPWWSVVAFFMVLCAGVQFLVLLAQLRSAGGGGRSTPNTPPASPGDDHV